MTATLLLPKAAAFQGDVLPGVVKFQGDDGEFTLARIGREFVLTGAAVNEAAEIEPSAAFTPERDGSYSIRWDLNTPINRIFLLEDGEIVLLEDFLISEFEMRSLVDAIASLL